MIAQSELAELPGFAVDSAVVVSSVDSPRVSCRDHRPAGARSFRVGLHGPGTSTADTTRALAAEVMGLFQGVDDTGECDSLLRNRGACSSRFGWTADGGLGARLRREGPFAQDEVEELLNVATHALGLMLSLTGLYGLSVIAAIGMAPRPAAGCVVYGLSLVFLYAASTLYHARPLGRGKRVMLLFDYVGIYLLIAGTYTPIVMIRLGGPLGWSLLAAVWGIAAVGTLFKVGRFRRFEKDSPLPYLVMGGLWLVASRELIAVIPAAEFAWVVAGLAFYVGGFCFYALPERRFFHAVWHVFVLAGSICHYSAIVGCASTLAA
jgi:hemolysin III